MKRHILALALGLSLVSCDSGTKEADGTSSETQTALQALADNSFAIARNQLAISQEPSVAGRSVSVGVDSTDEEVRQLWCAGASESQYGSFQGPVYLVMRSAGLGPDGTRSSCSLEESTHEVREFHVDSVGRSDLRYSHRQYGGLERNVYQGAGRWDLRSGLTLIYRNLFADISSRKAVFRQEIELLGSCKLDLAFTDSATDTGWTLAQVDAPVVCGGKSVGRYLWDRVGRPRVLDSRGDLVPPRRILPQRLPEDTLGLRASVIGLQRDTTDSIARLRVEVRLHFLDWDTLAVVRWIELPSSSAYGRVLDSALWSGSSVDTVDFQVPLEELEGLQEPNTPILLAPFEGNPGGARSNPLRL